MGACYGGQKPRSSQEMVSGSLQKDVILHGDPAQDGQRRQREPQPLVKNAACQSVTIVVHTIGGENILGPKKYPSAVTLPQLQTEILAAVAGGPSVAGFPQLMHGDRILGRDDSIAGVNGQETLVLSCVFRQVNISADWRCDVRDWVQSWRLHVTPLGDNRQTAVEDWLLALNKGRDQPAPLEETGGECILADFRCGSKLDPHLKIEEVEWECLEAMMQQASLGQCVRWKAGGLASASGWRAAIAGHAITWTVELGF